MQVKDENRKSFKPVVIIFDDYDEYQAFKKAIADINCNYGGYNTSEECDVIEALNMELQG